MSIFTPPSELQSVLINDSGQPPSQLEGPALSTTALFNKVSSSHLVEWLRNENITSFTLLKAAWAIVLRSYGGSDTVSFSCEGFEVLSYDVPRTKSVRGLLEMLSVEAISVEYYSGSAFIKSKCTIDTLKEFAVAVQLSREVEGHRPSIAIYYKDGAMSKEMAEMVSKTTIQAMEQIIVHTESLVEDLTVCSNAEINCVFSWNRKSDEEPFPKRSVHEAVSRICMEVPDSIAVSAWDGEFSYAELDRLSSGLAIRLKDWGIRNEDFVALCFNKSKWVVVAILGVLKAGGAYVFLDCSLPMRRIRSICSSVLPTAVLCSPQLEALANDLTNRVQPLSNRSRAYLESALAANSNYTSQISQTSPSDAMYAIFTSGSTGQPKGIVTEHGAFHSVAVANGKALGVGPHTRMLQFAAYSFDVSNREIFITLMCGGCICIPSEDDRVNNLAQFINKYYVTSASLTPSLANLLSPESVPTLKMLVLGGEPMTEAHILTWARSVQLFNAYGVSESPGIACLLRNVQPGSSPRNIGFGCGSRLWIVDADNANQLIPIGAVGELVIEGRSLARHYIGEKEKTKSSFLKSTEWQTRFHDHSEKSYALPRLYCTGDLVRYNLDGSIHYVGRKDSQVKINGQRVELTEIEHHVRLCADTLIPETRHVTIVASADAVNGSTRLFGFIDIGCSKGQEASRKMTIAEWEGSRSMEGELKRTLRYVLPAHMIPREFFFVHNIAMTQSGKIDRVSLRKKATELFLVSKHGKSRMEGVKLGSVSFTPDEAFLRELWADVLGIEGASLRQNDCFFQRGGDSIDMMNLVAKLRETGHIMKIADAFKSSTLAAMSLILVKETNPCRPVKLAPFSLLRDCEAVLGLVRENLKPDCPPIQDVYPCTPLQAGLIALTAQDPNAYIAQYAWKLPKSIDLCQFKRACELAWEQNPILRTRFIQVPSGIFQVVLADEIPWYANECDGTPSKINIEDGPLVRFHVRNGILHLEIHHSIFDEWSLDLLLRQIESAYAGKDLHPRPFNPFVQLLLNLPVDDSREFWAKEFAGLKTAHFLALPSHPVITNRVTEKAVLEEVLELDRSFSTRFTLSSVLRLAWAIVLWHRTGCEDVLFGATVTGRSAGLHGIDQLSGPTLSTVPLRIMLSPHCKVNEMLLQVQNQFAEMMPYEQTGLIDIRKIGPEAAEACNFQTVLVVQSRRQQAESSMLDSSASVTAASHNINTFAGYPLMLTCRPGDKSITFTSSYHPSNLPRADMDSILRQMIHVTRQLIRSDSTPLADIGVIPQQDIKMLMHWNSHDPVPVNACVHDLFQLMSVSQPHRPAVCSKQAELTYGQLDRLSSQLASLLISQGIRRGHFVPIVSEKSPWIPVAVMGVLKAGAAFALLDPSFPVHRLKSSCAAMEAHTVISSVKSAQISKSLELQAHVLELEGLLHDLNHANVESVSLPALVTPDDPAYVVFTSGSTGNPKGVVISHSAICTSAKVMHEHGKVGPESRVFQFAGHAFDISVGDHLFTLAAGGCICMPSDEDRMDNPAKAAAALGVNWLFTTPSVITLMKPSDIPTLKVLCSAGEPLTPIVIEKWAKTANIVAFYGIAECAVISHVAAISLTSDCSNIGQSPAAISWIADPENHNKLAPIGTVGELLIEGPVVGSGYLQEPEKTIAAFIRSPSWRADFPTHPGRMYKTGDLVRYAPDGTLQFIGRKDLQVKLNGQRLEIGDIEQCVTSSSPNIESTVVELIKKHEKHERPFLVAFIRPTIYKRWSDAALNGTDMSSNGVKTIACLTNQYYDDLKSMTLNLGERLPAYMIPTYFIPITEVPLNMSGKTNRRQLQETVSTWSPLQISSYQWRSNSHSSEPERPTTEEDLKIQRIIGQALNREPKEISLNENFFALGGDSITAMQVSMLARQEGLPLTVVDIFRHETLSELTSSLTRKLNGHTEVGHSMNGQTFCREGSSLIPKLLCREGNYQKLSSELPRDITENAVKFLPTTEFQAMTLSKFYNRYLIISLPNECDLSRMSGACEQLVRRHSSLRTVFGICDDHSIVQGVLRELKINPIHLSGVDDIERSCADDSLAMGSPANWKPAFQAWLVTSTSSRSSLVLRMAHAQFDGISIGIICEDLMTAYNGNVLPPAAQFSDHVKEIMAIRSPKSYDTWRRILQNSQMTSFTKRTWAPANGSIEEKKKRDIVSRDPWIVTASTKIPVPSPPSSITIATLIKSAWAMTLMRLSSETSYDSVKHVVFGQYTLERGLGIPHEGRLVGPSGSIIPVRVDFPPALKCIDLMRQVQQQHIETMPVQSLAFKDIVQNCTTWEPETKFGSFLRIQNYSKSEAGNFELHGVPCETSLYSLPNKPSETANVFVIPDESELRINMTMSSEFIDQETADYVVSYFEDMIRCLSSEPSSNVLIDRHV
ncbi:uncharacterized protein N7503_011987 [Penicillium pulvis]|uniref:uncharacterized protein n=1 Tax=Penicillium pulvis TaxID=1562058 RepID=UPI002547D1EB|nr:uncharacterized protein N7503_011987 [Penicillium pulvis]KAJ5786775.1 hypothetical protein N7503_011987 [Penicillium pulvis]